jgi:antirestriction protein ArdC
MKLSKKAQASLNKVVDRFKAGDLSPIRQVLAIKLPPDAPARQWTMTNRIIAGAQTLTADNRGYRQWESAGRQVKKGSRAGFILYPRTVRKEDKSTGEETQMLIGFGTTPVFGVDDTDGEPIADYEPASPPALADVAQRLGVNVAYCPIPDALGYCMADNSKIRLATHDESTFFHELAHAAHNTFERKTTTGQDPYRETVADFTACILMDLYGLRDDSGNTWHYISHYNDDPLTAIMKALSDVEKVLKIILEDN